MSSFQAKLGWKRQRKRENKIFRFVPFVPDCVKKISKKQQKKSKNCKTPLGLLFKPKQVGQGREKEKIKIIVPINSCPTRNKEYQKNRKHHYGFFSSQNRLRKAEKERK